MRFALAAATICLTLGIAPSLAGQTTVIGLMAGTADGLPVVLRIASGLDHHEGLRVLPIAGQGPLQSLNDLVHLKGIDAALLQSDALSYAQRTGLLDVSPKKLSYIVKLGHLDVHVLTRKDIVSLADLAGARIAVGPTSSAS